MHPDENTQAEAATTDDGTPRATALQWAAMDAQQRHDLWSVLPLSELGELSATMLDEQRALFAEARRIREHAEAVMVAREALDVQLRAAHASDGGDPDGRIAERTADRQAFEERERAARPFRRGIDTEPRILPRGDGYLQ